MLRGIQRTFVSGLLAVALLLPVFTQVFYKDAARQFFCAPTGQLTPAAANAVAQMRELLHLPDGTSDKAKHCEQCVLTFSTDLASHTFLTITLFTTKSSYKSSRSIGWFYIATGPPFGSRAPPTHSA